MSSNLIGELVANNGTYFLQNVETEYEGNIDQIIVRGQGVQISISMNDSDGNKMNVTEEYLQNGKNNRLPDGLRITPKGDDVFTSVRIEINSLLAEGSGLELVLA
jgi:hypothetical protein